MRTFEGVMMEARSHSLAKNGICLHMGRRCASQSGWREVSLTVVGLVVPFGLASRVDFEEEVKEARPPS